MNSEEGYAWTLVMSFSLKNKAMDQIDRKPLGVDAPLNDIDIPVSLPGDVQRP